LITAISDEPLIDALDKVNEHRFDYLPVRRSINGPIIGIVKGRERGQGRMLS
jgi:hypothetical protein